MSVTLQTPVSQPPIMHMSSTEEPASRGTLPEGKTMEKVIAVLSEFIKHSIRSAHNRLEQKNLSVDDLYKLSHDKKGKKSLEALVTGLLGTAGGVSTVLSGLGFVAAPWFQQFNHGITPDSVARTAEAAAGIFRTGNDTFKAYQEGLLGELDTRYSIQQSMTQSHQQSNTWFEQSVTRTQELISQITSSNSRASGG